MNINDAIKIMKFSVKNEIAKAYLETLEYSIDDHGTHGLVNQLNYIMCNVSSWKGSQAKEVKTFVKDWIKEKNGNNTISPR
jgi:hypothetical protein